MVEQTRPSPYQAPRLGLPRLAPTLTIRLGFAYILIFTFTLTSLYHQMIFDTDKVEFKRRVDHCVIASQETVYDDQNNSPLAFHQPSVSRLGVY